MRDLLNAFTRSGDQATAPLGLTFAEAEDLGDEEDLSDEEDLIDGDLSDLDLIDGDLGDEDERTERRRRLLIGPAGDGYGLRGLARVRAHWVSVRPGPPGPAC